MENKSKAVKIVPIRKTESKNLVNQKNKVYQYFYKGMYLLSILLPLLFLIFTVKQYQVNMPFVDEWEFIPLLEKSYQGSLSISDFWAQHNQHRPFFSRIIILILARLTSWDIRYEIGVNILLSIVILWVIISQVQSLKRINYRFVWLMTVISIMIFSLNQFENWLFGWTMHIFLNILAVVVGIRILSDKIIKWKHIFVAIAMGIIATYSFAGGLFFWLLGSIFIISNSGINKSVRRRYSIVWIVISILIIFSYFWQFTLSSDQPSIFLFLTQPISSLLYILAYLGRPVVAFFYHQRVWAVMAGIYALIFSTLMIIIMVKDKYSTFSELKPFLMYGLYTILTGFMTMLGRVGSGYDQATSSRYITITNLFWVYIMVVVYLFGGYLGSLKLQSKLLNLVLKLLYQGTVIVLLVSVVRSSLQSTQQMKSYNDWFLIGYQGLLSSNMQQIREVARNEESIIRQRIEFLKKYQLSLFGDRSN